LHADVQQPFTYLHVFLDDDANPATGYPIGGVGAGYLIENGNLYRWVGPGWAWSAIGSASMGVSGASHDWSIPRATVGGPAGAPGWSVGDQAKGGSPPYVAPVYAPAFTP